MRRLSLFLLVVAAVTAVVLALGMQGALTAPDSALPWSVFGSGSGTSSSTNYELGSTTGQSSPIGQVGSTNFSLTAGYWYGAVDSDGEGLVDILDPCPSVADCDADGWTDWSELVYIGIDPLDGCPDDPTDDANPADLNNDTFFTSADLSLIAGVIGLAVPPAPSRRDIAPDTPDGFITSADLSQVAARIGTSCAP